MNLLDRISNLWKLSDYTPALPKEKFEGTPTELVHVIKKDPPKQVFIPRITRDPVKELTDQS